MHAADLVGDVAALQREWLARAGRPRAISAAAKLIAILPARPIAESKGLTDAPRTDIDTLWAQIPRRVSESQRARFAVVVPTGFVSRTLEVASGVRTKLGVTSVYEVTDSDQVIDRS